MIKNYNDMYDLIIVGGGPAGLSAAIYMSRAKYKTLVLEKEKFGGQITITSEIVNYPGVISTSGTKLTQDMQKQAAAFGAEFKLEEVLDMDLSGDIKIIKTNIREYKTFGVILALGAYPRQIGFKGENEYKGRGVAYCATCDGEFFTDMPIYVIGGGLSAVQEGTFLTKYSKNVQIIVRDEKFNVPEVVSDALFKNEFIKVHFNTEVKEVSGDNTLKSITLVNNKTGEEIIETNNEGIGVFVFVGYAPNTEWLDSSIKKDRGYLVTNANQETNVPGVYGAGDVCVKDLRQVVTAVSNGATAAVSAEKYISNMHTKLDIPAFKLNTSRSKKILKPATTQSDDNDKFLSQDMIEQLLPVFDKFENKVIINAVLNESLLAEEMSGFVDEIGAISDKIITKKSQASKDELAPYLQLLYEDETESGIKFFAMPGGHEFNSFIISLYNVAGPGKAISEDEMNKVKNLNSKANIKVLISLHCTMCPEVVMSCGKISTLNKNITTEIIDIAHFNDLKEKYNVMSVPCMVIDDKDIYFGRKNISQILDILG
ncbi:thioredoxin reductase [Candidatus Epulonipiscioides gigas]|nr:thioredoxin reductase [Epulopiscium sp. SCG-C07WGA-EpuloA2]